MIPPWVERAHKMIQDEAWRRYRAANMFKNGKWRKRHQPYTLPDWANDLVKAIGENDEEKAKAIMLYRI